MKANWLIVFTISCVLCSCRHNDSAIVKPDPTAVIGDHIDSFRGSFEYRVIATDEYSLAFDSTFYVPGTVFVSYVGDSVKFSDNVVTFSIPFDDHIGYSGSVWCDGLYYSTFIKNDTGRYTDGWRFLRISGDSLLCEVRREPSDIQYKGGGTGSYYTMLFRGKK